MPRATNGIEIHLYDGVGFDSDGCGPYTKAKGCPNCGAGAGWSLDGGYYDGFPCSRACVLQLEYAASRDAARKRRAAE